MLQFCIGTHYLPFTDGVKNLISNINGTVDIILDVEYGNKTRRRIRNDEMSENMEINIDESSLENEINNILFEGRNIESLTYTSDENANIYERNLGKIIPFKRN